MMKTRRTELLLSALLLLSFNVGAARAQQQQQVRDYRDYYEMNESERSDKFTGGHIERAELRPGDPDLKITVDVPAFRLTLWQAGREVKSYYVGVGQKEFPIAIGHRAATNVIWNPAWIPPDSSWVSGHKGVQVGEVIPASDPRNPLGKLKIPLGDGYLIHQAAKPTDLGNLVSHGCVRMLRSDLYDLSERIVTARSLNITPAQIAQAKRTTKMLDAKLDTPLPVHVSYDTQVIEAGTLHLYPDVYERGRNTVANLRAELDSSKVDTSRVDDDTLRDMLARVTRREQFVVSVESLEAGRALIDGRTEPIIPNAVAAPQKKASAKGGARR